MRILVCLSLILMASNSWAQKPAKATPAEIPSTQTPAPIHALLAYGSEARPEKAIDGTYSQHNLTNYALGVGFDQFVFIFEKAEFNESSGNAALSVDRKFEDYLLWGQYRALSWYHLVPFMAAGVGAYKETVVTNLSGISKTDQSANKLLTGLSFGLSLDIPVLWLSIEGRILFGDELDRQPTLGGLARIGVHF